MNRNEKTLVILIPGFAKDEADSTCLPMQQNFVKSLNLNYPNLNIIILAFEYPYVKSIYSWFANPVISFNGRNKGGLSRFFVRRQCMVALKDIHQKNKIIGLLSFWYGECALVGKKFAGKNNLPHYCWLMGQDAKKENKYPHRFKLKASELIALSDFQQKEFEKNHGIKPASVITPGIDINEFPGIATSKSIDIIGAGSLISLKQYPIFIEVIAEIKKIIPSVKVLLIGNGPEKSKLENLIASLGLQSNITLTGELPHRDVLQCMQKGKIFLHPSSYESFGVVCIEALYAGCHVISFCKPMKNEIHHWHNVSTKEEMTQKVLAILQNKQTSFTKTAPYLIEDTAKMIMKLFD